MLKHKEQSSPLPTVEEVPPKGVGIVNVRRDRNSRTGCADPSDKCFAPFVSEGWVLLTGKPRVRKMAFSPWQSVRHSRFVGFPCCWEITLLGEKLTPLERQKSPHLFSLVVSGKFRRLDLSSAIMRAKNRTTMAVVTQKFDIQISDHQISDQEVV